MLRIFFTVFFFLVSASPSLAALKSQTLDYSYGGKTFKGYLVWDDALSGKKRPGALVFHEFWGLDDYAKSRADQLAKLGYVALAADLYGGGKVFTHPDAAGAMAGEVRKNVADWVGRAQAALKALRAQALVDPQKVAAIGYCLGGATVLQLAYSGADLAAVVSFHGALPIPETTKDIKAKILILHGEKDPFVTEETIRQLKAALDAGKVDYRVVIYPEAMHSFTVSGSEKRGAKGVAYNAEADKKSWEEMLKLFEQVFGKRG